ncbi:MAG: Abi family protein [bacterium]|nr:Abi family protein [bacterium]
MAMNKDFKTLEEQIIILEYKGLKIEDKEFVKKVLLRENYFFLNGYRHLFLKSNNDRHFIEGTTFEEIYSLFLFDRQFRNILFKNLLIIENNMKSIISYQLSHKYGYKESDYLKTKNFTSQSNKQRQINDLIKKMKRQVRINAPQHAATMHYVNNYGYIPLWVLVKVLSFGIVSELFSILKRDDQIDIANMYELKVDALINYLPILANYRNLCAHEDIVFENKTQRELEDTLYHKMLNINKVDDEYVYGKRDLFALVIIIKQMLKPNEFKNMVEEIDRALMNLEYNLNTITIVKVLDRMGFPENWKELANITKRVEE